MAGKDSSLSIAGAVSVIASKAISAVDIAGGKSDDKRYLKGGDIAVEATDKSRLAARAGGLSISKGSTLGMGLGSTTITSKNTVTATLGDYADIQGASFKLNAEKTEVTKADYANLITLRTLISDSSKLTDAERKEAKTGLIDIHKDGEYY